MLLLVEGLQGFNHLVKHCQLNPIALRKTQQHIPANVSGQFVTPRDQLKSPKLKLLNTIENGNNLKM
jgi:hypothetical protein